MGSVANINSWSHVKKIKEATFKIGDLKYQMNRLERRAEGSNDGLDYGKYRSLEITKDAVELWRNEQLELLMQSASASSVERILRGANNWVDEA